MNEFFLQCLILAPLLFLAGFVDAVAGGGSLISIPAYLFIGLPVHVAAGTDKVANSVGTTVSVVKYIRSGKVRLREAGWAALCAMPGAALGVQLALWSPERVLRAIVLAALPVVAVVLTVKKDFGREDLPPRKGLTRQQTMVLSCLIGFAIGVYNGLLGPGTGTFLIMAFTLVLGMDLLTASGCSKIGNLTSDVTSAVTWIFSGKVNWPLAVLAACCCTLGNWFGARYAIRGGSKRVRGMIFVVLILLFLKLGLELLA